ncbi:MAG: PatB family C-S lyase [Bacteroidales bacterium]|jgi:cystathionine beta-lyase|nr:PatB family C-S lyase [Bacteroidales bacterium]
MENYDFDKIVDRRGSGDNKHGQLKKIFGRDDLLPMWVADMDFETPGFITEAMRKRMEHSLFGYTMLPDDYLPAIQDWIATHHGWKVEKEWISYIPGIVKGIGMVVNVFVKPDEKVIIQPPVYHPFRLTPQRNGREVVFNPLMENSDGSYSMDFENLEHIASDPKCRLLILSNPHNPAGIVWPEETLKTLAEICSRHHLLVISDEIHCDMALFGHKHIPFASVSPEAAECSITFQAPSKTFNIAGIVSSFCVIPNVDIRNKFFKWLDANEFNAPDIFSPIATIAAYRQGEPWRKELIKYLEKNVLLTEDFCRKNMPAIKPLRPQASFLIWLDCRGLKLPHEELIDLFVNKAHLALNDGEMFGKEGAGFMRLNIGTPTSVVEKALKQLRNALI